MNNALREALSWLNETGLCLSLLISIGYFGSRQQLGILPGVALLLFVSAGLGLIIMMLGQRQEEDFSETKGDKALWWVVCFLSGTALFTWIGSLL